MYESALKSYPELRISYAGALRQTADFYSSLGREESSRELRTLAEDLMATALHYERFSAR